MTVYIDEASAKQILTAAKDSAQKLAGEAAGATAVFDGLLRGPLANDSEAALIVLRLFAGVITSAQEALEQAVVDLYYSDKPSRPAVNEIARSAGISVTLVKAWADRAERMI